MVAPQKSTEHLAEAELMAKVMLEEMIMQVCFFIGHLIRKESWPEKLDMPRQVGRYTVEIKRKAFHGATVAALKKKLVKKSSDSEPMKEEDIIGQVDYTC